MSMICFPLLIIMIIIFSFTMYYDLQYTRKIFVAKYSMCAQNNIYLSRLLAGFNVRTLF